MRTRPFKTFVAALLSAMTLLSAIGCGEKEPAEISVSGVSVSKTSITIKEGASESLTATVTPADASNKMVNWSSSNSSVATVDNSGRVTGVKAGSATVTVTTSDGGKTATCSVTVEANIINVTGVTLDKATAALTPGAEVTLAATVAPADATDKTVSWTSSDASVATVSNGKVKAVGAGKATITVKTVDGSKTATCEVTVTVPVEGVTLSETEAEVPEEGELTLTATVTPDNASDKAVTWASSDAAVATVSEGKVTGVKAGEAVITVTTADGGKTAECKITVTPKAIPVESVSVDEETLTIIEGGFASITATITPAEATNKTVSYKSSDATVATVDAEGKVTGVKAGKATITVTTEDGGKTATCAVTVTSKEVKVTGVSLNKTTLTIAAGSSETLTATLEPTNATNQNVTWKSSNTSVAIVSTTGEVIAKAKGTTTITVTTQDGSKTAKCTVTVTQPVTKIEILNPSGKAETFHWQYITYKDKTYKLSAKVYPTNANNTKVTWRSSNTDAFTVDQNGLVTFKKESFNEYVIAEAQDGSGVVGRIDFSINERTANQITLTSSGGTGSYQTRPNGTFKVTAALSPDPFNNKVTWSLNSTSCAKIESTTDLTCTIRGLKNTTASNPVILTATYRSLNGEVTKTVSKQIGILGSPYISEISIGGYMQVTAGSSYNTSATVTPSTADVKAVKWVTSDSNILKLTYDDSSDKRRVRLNGVKKGTVTIYCRATDGSGVESNKTRVDVQ